MCHVSFHLGSTTEVNTAGDQVGSIPPDCGSTRFLREDMGRGEAQACAGMLEEKINALTEAFFGANAGRLMLLQYPTLIAARSTRCTNSSARHASSATSRP